MSEIINELRSKSILITGATGLICSNFVDFLMDYNEREKLGVKIYAVSRNEEYAKKRFYAYWCILCLHISRMM